MMTIDRINELFISGAITSEEHQYFVKQQVPVSPANSLKAVLTQVFAAVGWALMLTFTKDGIEIGLLSDGTQRLWAGGICSFLSLICYIRSARHTDRSRNSDNFAFAGPAIAVALLTIVVPVILLYIS